MAKSDKRAEAGPSATEASRRRLATDQGWVIAIVKAVGPLTGKSFDRNVGAGIKGWGLRVGLQSLWEQKGGIQSRTQPIR